MTTLTSTSPAVLNTPTLIALVALKGYKEYKNGHDLEIEDLSKYLVLLKKGGIDISKISLNISVGNYWSEDIAQFVSEGILFGDIEYRSPIKFTDKCYQVCRSAIDTYVREHNELKPLVSKAGRILDVDI